ncbi:MAG: ribosome recycling factor [Mycoplasma sp.]|nr:ribosome recycling factor [Mycoplasma sp.]
MDLDFILDLAKEEMNSKIDKLKSNLSKISAGSANPKLLESVKVNYYEEYTPISQLASISAPEARQLLIVPFDRSILKDIVHSIRENKILGLNPQDEGDKIRIIIPPLTREKRLQFVKMAKEFTETSKIAIRQIRQHSNKEIKALKLPEDSEKDAINSSQDLTNESIKKIDEIFKIKESELLTI